MMKTKPSHRNDVEIMARAMVQQMMKTKPSHRLNLAVRRFRPSRTARNLRSGFTILELALAMAFVSFLLLGIGTVTIQISRIYQKGVTIKMVNSTGRELIDEFSRTLLASKYDRAEDSTGSHFEYTYTGQVQREVDGIDEEVPLFGAFCTGSYSYIWNTGYALNSDEDEYKAKLSVEKPGVSGEEEVYAPGSFRLLRINDSGHEVCANYAESDGLSTLSNAFVISGDLANPTELLPDSEGNLALYDLSVYEPAYHNGTGDALFPISFILGTLSGDPDITAAGDFCKSSTDSLNSKFTYCSINKFNFATRATGGLYR